MRSDLESAGEEPAQIGLDVGCGALRDYVVGEITKIGR